MNSIIKDNNYYSKYYQINKQVLVREVERTLSLKIPQGRTTHDPSGIRPQPTCQGFDPLQISPHIVRMSDNHIIPTTE